MDGWNTTFLLGRPIFRGYVSFRERAYFYCILGRFSIQNTLNTWSLSPGGRWSFEDASTRGAVKNRRELQLIGVKFGWVFSE